MVRKVGSFAFTLGLALAACAAWAGEDVSKINGSIRTEPGRQYGSLETVNGAIRIVASTRSGDASTVNGGIELEPGAQSGALGTVNGGIRIGREATVAGSVQTVNGGIFADRGSRIAGDIGTVNGAIGLVAAELQGGVATVNGDITIGVDSHVRGGITVERAGGWLQTVPRRRTRIVIGPRAVVDGALTFHREVDLHVHRSARIGPVSGAKPLPFDSETAPRD